MKDKTRILIAYDGSDYADAAIESMRDGGFPTNVDAVVLCVIDAWEFSEPVGGVTFGTIPHPRLNTETIGSHSAEAKERIQAQAEAAAQRVRELFPGWNVSAEARLGKPAWEIIESSDDWEADLIVIGSHGRSALARLLLGSVSQKVLAEARCSVRISRKRSSHENAKPRILIAVDGSINAATVVNEVASRSWTTGTEIRLVAVDDPFARPEAGYLAWNLKEDAPVDNEKSRAWISTIIGAPEQVLKDAGLTVTHSIRWGDAAAMILEEAGEWGPDSIFMGARGLGRFQRFWIGSVSSTVAARAECSVEVVRTKEDVPASN